MEDIKIKKKKKINPIIQPGVANPIPTFETKAKIEIKASTYNKLIAIPIKMDSSKRTVDTRISLLMDMRKTYLDLFGYLRKFYPDVIGEYSNMLAVKAQGKDRFKEGYISW